MSAPVSLVSWATGKNYNAWHCIERWVPAPTPPLWDAAHRDAMPKTLCGLIVPPKARVYFREADRTLRPAECCQGCWPPEPPSAA